MNIEEMDDYLIRDSVFDEIENKTPVICEYLLKNGIDYENDAKSLGNVLFTFIDHLDEMTDPEMSYCINHVQVNTAIRSLLNDGLIEKVGDTYKVKD